MFRNELGFRATKAVLPVAMLCVLGLQGQAKAQEFDLIDQGTVQALPSNACTTCNNTVINSAYPSPTNGVVVYTAAQSNGFNSSTVSQAYSSTGCTSCNSTQPVFSNHSVGTVYSGQTIQPVVYQNQGYVTQSYPVQSYPTQSYPTQSYPSSSYSTVAPVVSGCSTCSNYVAQGSSVDLGVIEGVNANYAPTTSSHSAPNYTTPAATYTSSVPHSAPVVSTPVVSAPVVSSPVISSPVSSSYSTPAYATPTATYTSSVPSTARVVSAPTTFRSSAPVYSSPAPRTFRTTVGTRTGQPGLAQSKAARAAQMGLRGHLGGGLGGAKYEGVGWSSRSPQDAIENCCYWGTRPTAQIGVSKGNDGCWYACVLYQ